VRSRGVYGDARYRICRAFGALRTFLQPASLLILNFSKAPALEQQGEARRPRGTLAVRQNFLAMVLRGGVVRSCRWAQKNHPRWWGAEDARANLPSQPADHCPFFAIRCSSFLITHLADSGGDGREVFPPREIGAIRPIMRYERSEL